ncbi:hypothetical protein [Frigoriglobus tundricola]|uniref:Uncharacterized protein n=1 Tax=Frigoriglobus tundricola TaxID=2774151 RepID=A0A6M5YRF0_9BACT|nr:hypothetical protein [Frigoriglobus tundricola]QJW96014.1 hypothetical protein FTUN_3568 [Frigoriglobus tundricola]
MTRLATASVCVLLCALAGTGADPTPVEKQLAVQNAIASARKHLDSQNPTEAVAVLEQAVASADGNKVFLALLREAYVSELYQLGKAPNPDAERLAQTRRRLALLGGAPPAPADAPKPVPAALTAPPTPFTPPDVNPTLVTPIPAPASIESPTGDRLLPSGDTPVSQPFPAPARTTITNAIAAFKKENFAEADRLFGTIGAAKLTPEQKTAWAYCRIKLAADRVNAPACDAGTAAAAAQSVDEALTLITDNAKLLASGRAVLKAAQAKAGSAGPVRQAGGTGAPVVAVGDAIETANFRVVCGSRDLGDTVSKAAEASRKQIFERWSGPPSGVWQPKCEIVVHATADAYAKATGKPAEMTGHATVRITNGRVTERRVDLWADTALVDNALPRELTHVVLTDLFSDKPPPKWALEGMAILAGSPEEIGRYTRTLTRCAREGEVRPLAALFDLNDFPADKITGFYCQSASVVEYLIKLKGERNFKIFLSDAQRYGTSRALERQYGIEGTPALDAAWKRACLEPTRTP